MTAQHTSWNRRQFLSRVGLGGTVLAVGGGLTGLLAACGTANDKPQTSSGTTPVAGSSGAGGQSSAGRIGTLTVSFSTAPPTLDIATALVGNVATMMLVIHEPLVTYDNDLVLIPWLASKWDQSKPNEYTFTLRDGVKFSDGSALTADDVVYSIKRHTDKSFPSQLAGYFSTVTDVTGSGQQVTITLKDPDETFPYVLSLAGIVKESIAKPLGAKYAEPGTAVVGTGAYTVTSFTANQGIELAANPKYWGTAPKVDAVSVKIIPDESARQLAMRSGDTMMSYDVSLSQVKQWKAVDHVDVPVAPGLESSMLAFDLSQAPWDDLHVRKAVCHCWDPQFVTAVMGDAASPAVPVSAPVPPGMWANAMAQADTEKFYAGLPVLAFDLEAAKAELAQSAHAGGFSATIAVPNTSPNLQKAALSLADNLGKIGIKLDVQQQPQQTWKAYQQAHQKLGLQLTSVGPDYPDPANYYGNLFLSANATPNNNNLSNYKNPEFDKLVAQQAGEQDKAKRTQLLQQLLTMLVQDVPVLTLWWSGFAVAYRSDLMRYSKLTSLCYLQPWLTNVSAP